MSSRVVASAVAVSAIERHVGEDARAAGRAARTPGGSRGPTGETQCASSMANSASGQLLAASRGSRHHEPLGRDVEQVELARPQLREHLAASSAAPSDELRQAAATPLARSASTWSFISEMSGETTIAVPGSSSAGHLEAQRLPAAGRHQHERVAAGDHVLDDLELARPERVVAEDAGEHFLRGRCVRHADLSVSGRMRA